MEATTTLPKAKTRCGPEFATQAYLACTKGVADARQQQSAAAQLAIAKADKAALLEQLQCLLAYADSLHRLEAQESGEPMDYETFPGVRAAIRKATA